MTSCAGSRSPWQDGSVWKEDEHSPGRWDRTEINREDRQPQRWEEEDEE